MNEMIFNLLNAVINLNALGFNRKLLKTKQHELLLYNFR